MYVLKNGGTFGSHRCMYTFGSTTKIYFYFPLFSNSELHSYILAKPGFHPMNQSAISFLLRGPNHKDDTREIVACCPL